MKRRDLCCVALWGAMVAGWILGAGSRAGAQEGVIKVDPKLESYEVVSGVSGNLSSVGSDTLNNLMTLWSEAFRKKYPTVRTQIEGKGSGTAPPALIAGTSQLGPMSRPMKSKEMDAFEKKFGHPPTRIRVAVDALAVFVHKDNPIRGLTYAQIDAIFSKTRRLGHEKDISTWGDLGLKGEWKDKPISLYGRNSASGTYGVFKKRCLGNGDYRDTVKEQPGSASVVLGVATDRYAIGYSGIGYATSSVRAVPVAEDDKDEPAAATADNAYAGRYPLARFLYIYVNRAPDRPLEPMIHEFLRFVLSLEGQQVVVKDGYFPIPSTITKEELAKLK